MIQSDRGWTPADLERGAEAIAYRIEQMVRSGLTVYGMSAPTLVVKNALIESVLGNARSLVDFLRRGGRRKYVLAVDFAPKWPGLSRTRASGKLYTRISETLSHATYEKHDLNWDLWTIINDVMIELELLRSEYLSPPSSPSQERLQRAITNARALFASAPRPPDR